MSNLQSHSPVAETFRHTLKKNQTESVQRMIQDGAIAPRQALTELRSAIDAVETATLRALKEALPLSMERMFRDILFEHGDFDVINTALQDGWWPSRLESSKIVELIEEGQYSLLVTWWTVHYQDYETIPDELLKADLPADEDAMLNSAIMNAVGGKTAAREAVRTQNPSLFERVIEVDAEQARRVVEAVMVEGIDDRYTGLSQEFYNAVFRHFNWDQASIESMIESARGRSRHILHAWRTTDGHDELGEKFFNELLQDKQLNSDTMQATPDDIKELYKAGATDSMPAEKLKFFRRGLTRYDPELWRQMLRHHDSIFETPDDIGFGKDHPDKAATPKTVARQFIEVGLRDQEFVTILLDEQPLGSEARDEMLNTIFAMIDDWTDRTGNEDKLDETYDDTLLWVLIGPMSDAQKEAILGTAIEKARATGREDAHVLLARLADVAVRSADQLDLDQAVVTTLFELSFTEYCFGLTRALLDAEYLPPRSMVSDFRNDPKIDDFLQNNLARRKLQVSDLNAEQYESTLLE